MMRLEERDTRSTTEPQPTPEAQEIYLRWIHYLDNEFARHHKPHLRAEIVREQLHQLYLSQPGGAKLNFTLTTELPTNILQLSLDPRNVTLPEEYEVGIDHKRYDERKPLIWLWRMFDRSPVGLNQWLGLRFRAVLGRHIFRNIGSNVLIYSDVRFTFGYNITLEDDCILEANAVLDDRSPLTVRHNTTIPANTVFPSNR